MGYRSWLTADTHESILVSHLSDVEQTVYLLQPNGAPPIVESAYDGYGTFGDTTVTDWLVEHNAPADRIEDLRKDFWYGIQLETGLRYFRDVETGERFAVFHTGACAIDPAIVAHHCTYAAPLSGYGLSANALREQGRIVEERLPTAFPLKFSFDPTARYEDLPGSVSV